MTDKATTWNIYKLDQLVNRIVGGGTPPRSIKAYWDGNLPWASVKDFQDEKSVLEDTEEHISIAGLNNSSSSLIEPNVVVICTRMAVGRAAITKRKIAINQDLKALYTNDLLKPHYLLYALQHKRHQLEAVAIGSTVKGITLDQLLNLSLYLPSPEEQRLITTILATIDAAIQNAERVIAKQKAIRAGLLVDLLTYGLDANGESRDPLAHPEQFQESPLGLIPTAWELSDVNTEFEISSGFTLGAHRRPKNHPRPYLRVANVQRERITLDDVLELEASDAEMRDKRLEVGDLLVVEGHANPEEIGRCAIVNPASAGLTYQNHLFRLRAKRLLPQFALAWLNSSWTQDYWRRLSRTSSGLHTINQSMLRAVLVPVPSEDEQKEIAQVIGIQDDVIKDSNAHLNKLIAKKKGLMDDLLTGRVRVSDVRLDEVMERES